MTNNTQSLRFKIADFVSILAATRVAFSNMSAEEQLTEERAAIIEQSRLLSDAEKNIATLYRALDRRRVALEAIAAMETPNANATVKRMAKVARDALK